MLNNIFWLNISSIFDQFFSHNTHTIMATTDEARNTTVASTSTTTDHGNPFFVYPSDSQCAILALVPVDGVGYHSLQRSML